MLEKVKANLEKQFNYTKLGMNFEYMWVVVGRLLETRRAELG
jgi:hypothetical protein